MKKYKSVFSESESTSRRSSLKESLQFDDYIKREFSDRDSSSWRANTLIKWIQQQTGKTPDYLFRDASFYQEYVFNIDDLGLNLGRKSLSQYLLSSGLVDDYKDFEIGSINGYFLVSFRK